ncbi:hypothetical protein [Aquirhabdus parva]|uniref:Uncharacterized protein n=1 Tax=Aquirhabdus parva TaxID=2283318 RepID=A0A345P6A2_9GAMM|nr:hypothetical protein [Aquirhabdus parva]AXI02811.1 hypothetical protein HYN46_08165 [Aquirhabdus parva]
MSPTLSHTITHTTTTSISSFDWTIFVGLAAVIAVFYTQWRFDARQKKDHKKELLLKRYEILVLKRHNILEHIVNSTKSILLITSLIDSLNDSENESEIRKTIESELSIHVITYFELLYLINMYLPDINIENLKDSRRNFENSFRVFMNSDKKLNAKDKFEDVAITCINEHHMIASKVIEASRSNDLKLLKENNLD